MATIMKTKICFCILLLFPFIGNAQKIYTVVGKAGMGFSGDGDSATRAAISTPLRVHMDKAGNIYLADIGNYRIRKVSTSGIINTIVGNGVSARSGDGGLALSASLSEPIDVVTDDSGNVFILDNLSIRKVNKSGIITTIAGGDTAGYFGDGGPAALAKFHMPFGISLDSKGNLYVADMGNNVIRKIDKAGIITTVAGNGTGGYSGDGGPATAAQLAYPERMRVDAAGNIYIADMGNNLIRKVNTAGIITTIAGNGTINYSGDGGSALSAGLLGPTDLALDDSGNIFVASQGEVIRKINTAGIITTVAGTNRGGYNGDNIPADSAEFNEPRGVEVGKGGAIYVADAFNARIREITSSPLAVNEVTLGSGISVYPNPSSGNVTVSSKNTGITSIDLINLIGQTVYNHTYSKLNKVQLDLKDLTPGIYFLKVNGAYIQKLQKE